MGRRIKCLSLLFLLTVTASVWSKGICLPQDEESSSLWPVCAIYMHGLFGSSPYPESLYEVPFRNHLAEVARRKKCRIAVPIGDLNPQGRWNWNGFDIPEILLRAKSSCPSTPFVSTPDVIGFSNGANILRRQRCSTLSQFTRVTLIGPTGESGNAEVSKCGNVMIHQEHVVLEVSELMETITER